MHIESFYEPDSGTWTHLLADKQARKAAVIDPVWVYDPVSGLTDESFIDGVLERAENLGLAVEWVLETHAHADHLTAADLVKRRTGAKIACGQGICAVQKNFIRVFNMQNTPADGRQFDRLLSEGDVIRLGELDIHVTETPGHTADGITYRVGDAAFIGDTLFAPSYGTARCDFPGGDAGQLFDSIQKIYAFPTGTRLFLCHDYPEKGQEPLCEVSVDESMTNNVHVNSRTSRQDFVRMRTERDSKLKLPRLILPALQVNIEAGAAPAPESTGAGYLRIPFNRSIEELIKGEKE